MKKTAKRFFSMMLVLALVLSMAPMTVFAAPSTQAAKPQTSVQTGTTATEEKTTIDLSAAGFAAPALMNADLADIDENDPAIIAFEAELDTIKVLNAEGESVALTEEQKGTILYLYQQYLGNWAANADLLGAQTPFFLSYNDNADELGILGEMLVLANIPLEAVRAGMVSYDEITGMIQNFLYADALGVAFYGDIVRNARNEVLALVEASGAQTDVQKYMVINNWLAQNVVFDMPYIMNTDKEPGEEPMVAETPVKHEYYDYVYQTIYADYEASIRDTFEGMIVDGLKAEMKKQFYIAAIEAGFTSSIWTAVIEQFYIQGMMQQGLDEATATAQAQAIMEADADAISADPYAYCQGAFGEEGAAQAEAVVTEQVAAQMGQYADMINADPVAFVENVFGAEAAAQFAAMWDMTWADWEANGIPGMVAMFSAEMWPAIIEAFYIQGMTEQFMNGYGMSEEEAAAMAAEQTAAIMEQDAAAIAADPYAYCVTAFGEEGAAQAQYVVNDELAKMGIDGSTETNPEGRVLMAVILALQMETPQQDPMLQLPDGSYMTPNQAIPVFADQAAVGLTQGVLDYWQGHLFGAMGRGSAVCLGYTRAFAYLVQCLNADIYTTDGDIDNAASWKSNEELYYTDGELDINKGYVVDSVRISFDANVTMYGVTQENFNSDHFWNAVMVDGKWYYVDPCYVDGFIEVMMRDRVETDGSLNYMYFMFSHSTTTELYDGYYSEIKTLYADAATHTDYEDSWISRVKSNLYFDNGYAYYLFDSTDLITLLEETNNENNMQDVDMDKFLYKVVRHELTTTDAGTDGDTNFETLVEFNYFENEDDEESVARYLAADGTMVESELLTKLYAQHKEDTEKYPSISLSAVFYEGKVYFNLSNVILSYDVETCEIAVVKVYTEVSAQRDKTNPFGGMAFSVVDSADAADFTVKNHPITGLSLKTDGNLYVSIATNFAFISGKDPHNSADQGSFGYEFEETNFNADYNSYTNDKMAGYEDMGYEPEINDNDEFMWSANFVAVEAMTDIAASEYTEDVFAARDHEHHYIRFEETYYTKDDNGNWNTGYCYICPECYDAVNEPTEPNPDANYQYSDTTYEEQLAIYQEEKAAFDAIAAVAGHTYAPTDAEWAADSTTVTFKNLACSNVCVERANLLDCLIDNDASGNTPIAVELTETVTAEATVTGYTGNCAEGAIAIYTAAGEAEGYAFTATNEVALEAGQHAYEATFTWTETESGYTATADVACGICGDAHEAVEAVVVYDEANSTAATCTEAGKATYVATVTVVDENGNTVGTATSTKVVDLEKLPHNYENGTCTGCGAVQMTVPSIVSCYSKLQTSVKVTWTLSEGAQGYELWRTTTPDDDASWILAKTIKSGSTDRYTNQGLEIGTTYYYKVRAYVEDAEGVKTYTEFSAVDYMPAAVVFDAPYSNADFRIRLRWLEVSGAHGYQIWRMDDQGNWAIAKTIGDRGLELTNNQGGTTAYSNVGLEAGATYTYKMRAFRITDDGRKIFGAYSDECVVATMPVAPTVEGESIKAGRATISWDVLNAAGYQIWMADANGEYKIVKSITDNTVNTYTVSGLTSGETYSFKVRAYSEIEGKKTFGAYSNVVTVTVK